jgi:Caspase domain
MRHFWILALCLAMWSMAHTRALADTRVALVIGNGRYAAVPRLDNPPHDATAVADALKRTGFSVDIVQNASRADMIGALRDFQKKAENSDWAVIYYAGHGLEIGGTNYLVPIDAKLATDTDVQDEAVSLDRMMSAIESARQLRLVILDACRNNPFVPAMKRSLANRAIGRGLARVEPDAGTLVVYAAAHGQVAADGEGTNSPFATSLVRRLAQPGLEVRRLFDIVRDDVMDATAKEQQPFAYGSLSGRQDFYFIAPLAPVPPAGQTPPADAEALARADYALAEKIATLAAWDAFLAHHPTGILADLAKAERTKLTSASLSPAPPIQLPAAPPAEAERPPVRPVPDLTVGLAMRPSEQFTVHPAQIPIAPITPKPIVPKKKPEPIFAAPKPKPSATQETRETPKSDKCFIFNGNRVCE